MFVVPMLESELGWGSKIDGYAGPFLTLEEANNYRIDYNNKWNNDSEVPDWYISAQYPIPYKDGMKCDYSSKV